MARVRGGGFVLKTLQWLLRAIEFLCAAIVLGIFSYFLASLKNHSLGINNHIRAVEGISGAAALYTLVGLLLLCFVAGHTFFSLIAIILDIAFAGAFVYVAIQNKNGAKSCSGTVDTVYGTGVADAQNTVPAADGGSTVLPNFKQACQLQTACFSVSIVAILFFLISALVEIALWRHHKKEKAFGPSPANNYTAGSTPRTRRRFWQRKPKRNAALAGGALAAHEKVHPDSLPTHSTPADVRDSYQTDHTAVGTDPVYNKYGAGAERPLSGYTGTTGTTGTTTTGLGHTHDNSGYYAAPVTTGAGYREGIAHGSHTGEVPASQYQPYSVHNQGRY